MVCRATTTAGSCSRKSMYFEVHNNWLGLHQTAAAATSLSPLVAAAACCCVAVTRAPLRTNVVPFTPTWYFILHHHHQPRGRLGRCRTTHDMLQRIELMRILYYSIPGTFHSSWHGHLNEYAILHSNGGVLTVAIVAASLQRALTRTQKNEMTSIIGYPRQPVPKMPPPVLEISFFFFFSAFSRPPY